ncbi:helix-turn-helix domain-containing protein [Paenibacillus lactis]|uniref:helix-turn-helix domain-containing protein n=1 Tax=Paenibacillus lactis TaxID=228574 RepID=UPI003D733051
MQIKCYISSTLIDMGIETTNEELSTMWGVHRNTVTNLIKGKTLPNLQTAYMIVDYFNQQAELKGIARRWTVEDIWQRQK